MKLQNTELLNTQTSVEQQDSKLSSELIEREKFDDNPFELVTTEEGTFIALGAYRLTDYMQKDEAIEMVKNRHWDLIIRLNLALADVQKRFIQDLANNNNNI